MISRSTSRISSSFSRIRTSPASQDQRNPREEDHPQPDGRGLIPLTPPPPSGIPPARRRDPPRPLRPPSSSPGRSRGRGRWRRWRGSGRTSRCLAAVSRGHGAHVPRRGDGGVVPFPGLAQVVAGVGELHAVPGCGALKVDGEAFQDAGEGGAGGRPRRRRARLDALLHVRGEGVDGRAGGSENRPCPESRTRIDTIPGFHHVRRRISSPAYRRSVIVITV